MVHFVGAGPGAPDLITLRGLEQVRCADQIIYAGSLVNPDLTRGAKPGCRVLDSAGMTLEQVIEAIRQVEEAGGTTVRLHTGDPSIYGAIREQMDRLDEMGIEYDVTPGVSAFCASAAAIPAEFTLPARSQTVILTRAAGRTPVPEKERLAYLAGHGASMAIFLSAGLLESVQSELLEGGFSENDSAAIVYRASWPDQKVCRCTVGTLAETGRQEGITKTATILVGGFLDGGNERSKLYDPAFTHGYRKGTEADEG